MDHLSRNGWKGQSWGSRGSWKAQKELGSGGLEMFKFENHFVMIFLHLQSSFWFYILRSKFSKFDSEFRILYRESQIWFNFWPTFCNKKCTFFISDWMPTHFQMALFHTFLMSKLCPINTKTVRKVHLETCQTFHFLAR